MAEIHRITSRNAALLDSVAEEVFDERIDARCLQAYLADAAHLMLVAVEEGRVVGQCRAVVHLQPDQAPELYLDNLGVAPSHRRQGIARRLVAGMLALGRARGCRAAWVGTEVGNEPARALYRGFGAGTAVMFYCWDLTADDGVLPA